MDRIPKALSCRYEVKFNEGWITFNALPDRIDLRGFGTRRIGKLVGNREFLFTIGGHGKASEFGLNDAIKNIIEGEGIAAIEAKSTNSGKASYPGLLITSAASSTFGRILDRVEGAIAYIKVRHLA